jgi:hypothetical protein
MAHNSAVLAVRLTRTSNAPEMCAESSKIRKLQYMQLVGRRHFALTYVKSSVRQSRISVRNVVHAKITSGISEVAETAASETSGEEVITKTDKYAAVGSCKDCKGVGRLPLGGYHKKNPLNPAKLLGKPH